jgi:DeoR/GlpR family transcriptional regulator of sugar metabolism
MVAVGAVAMAAISQLRPDLFFLGVTAAHPVHGLSTGDFEEAAIKRHIAGCAIETYVLLTADKLDRASACQVLPVAAVSGLIVPDDIEEAQLAPYRSLNGAILSA